MYRENQPRVDHALDESFAKAQQYEGASLASFISSMSTSAVIFIIEIVLFLYIRSYFPDTYPKESMMASSHRPAGYLRTLIRFEIDYQYLDRYFFRRYLRTLLIIFLPAAVIIVPVLLPLNYIHGKASAQGVSGLDTLGWSNVGQNHYDRYWAHLFLAMLFIVYVCSIIWKELASYIEIKQNSTYAAQRTVLIESIPKDWMTEEALASQFDSFPGMIAAISFNRDLTSLSRLIARREKLSRCLEVAETRYIRRVLSGNIRKRSWTPCTRDDRIRPPLKLHKARGIYMWSKAQKVQATLFYHNELRRVNNQVQEGQKVSEKYPRLPSAFITFDNALAAHMVCQTVIHAKSGFMTPRMMPVSVDDIAWENISYSWGTRNVRIVISNVLIIASALLCVIPVVFIGLLSQIIYLTQAVPWLKWISKLSDQNIGLLQGVLPPVLLSILLKIYATVLNLLVQEQGIPLRSLMNIKIQDYYFAFLFVESTLLLSLSAGLTSVANELVSGRSVVTTLAKNLPKASNYFMSHILLQALSIGASSLLRIDLLLGRFVLGPIFDETVYQMLTRRRASDIQWGIFVPVYSNLACIGILYAIVSPIILPLQVFILSLSWVIHSESSVLVSKQDNGGLFYPKALKHLLSGLYLMEISLFLLFLLIRDNKGQGVCFGQALTMSLVTALTVVYHHLLCCAYNPLLIYSPTSGKNVSIRGPKQTEFLQNEILGSASSIHIPHDDLSIASHAVSRLRADLDGITINDNTATISLSGRIKLECTQSISVR